MHIVCFQEQFGGQLAGGREGESGRSKVKKVTGIQILPCKGTASSLAFTLSEMGSRALEGFAQQCDLTSVFTVSLRLLQGEQEWNQGDWQGGDPSQPSEMC